MSDDNANKIIEYISSLENRIKMLEGKIDKLTSVPQIQSEQMTMEELRCYIHTNPSESTVRRWMKEGLPHNKVGKRLVFLRTKVDEWLQQREDLSRFTLPSMQPCIAPWRAVGRR